LLDHQNNYVDCRALKTGCGWLRRMSKFFAAHHA